MFVGLLVELCGHLLTYGIVNHDTIQRFLPKTKRLIRLRVFKGSVLKDTGQLFQLNCPFFSKIQIFNW